VVLGRETSTSCVVLETVRDCGTDENEEEEEEEEEHDVVEGYKS
jgi:hypothetical protein